MTQPTKLLFCRRHFAFDVGHATPVDTSTLTIPAPKTPQHELTVENVGAFSAKIARDIIPPFDDNILVKTPIVAKLGIEFQIAPLLIDGTIDMNRLVMLQIIATNQCGKWEVSPPEADSIPANASKEFQFFSYMFAPRCLIEVELPELSTVRTTTVKKDLVSYEVGVKQFGNSAVHISTAEAKAITLAYHLNKAKVVRRLQPWETLIPLEPFAHLCPFNDLGLHATSVTVEDKSDQDTIQYNLVFSIEDRLSMTVPVVKTTYQDVWDALPQYVKEEHAESAIRHMAKQSAAKLANLFI